MTKDESLALLAQGKDAWNAWAQDLLDRKARLEGAGLWAVDERGKGLIEEAKRWEKEARVNFKGVTFSEEISFEEFIFPDQVVFDKSCFEDSVCFENTQFKGSAFFKYVLFKNDVYFENAIFLSLVYFNNSNFNNYVYFQNTQFENSIYFEGVCFRSSCFFDRSQINAFSYFYNAKFEGDFYLYDARIGSSISFENTKFLSAVSFDYAQFKDYVFFKNTDFEGSASFNGAQFKAYVYFEGAKFRDSIAFKNAKFMNRLSLQNAEFMNSISFEGAWFKEFFVLEGAHLRGDVTFFDATFEHFVGFSEVTFHENTSFYDVDLNEKVVLTNCRFMKRVNFAQSDFTNSVSFAGSVFEQEADFSGIDVQKTFSLAQTEFKQVPDFTEAHFREPPRLDHIRVALPGWWYFWGDPDREARFRALKRLALAAQDHENEQIFFKGELKERRGHTDRWYHPSYWLGWGYEILSDFGRSVLRPTLFWLAAVLVCACCYFYMSVKTPLAPGMPREMSTITALDNMLSAPLQNCRAGVLGDGRPYPGTRLTAALGISLGRGLLGGLGVEFGLEEKTHQFYSCLYGTHPPVLPAPDASPAAAASALLKHPPEALQYHIPTSVAFLGLLQSLFSAVLIFFFLLALRNRFKIK